MLVTMLVGGCARSGTVARCSGAMTKTMGQRDSGGEPKQNLEVACKLVSDGDDGARTHCEERIARRVG